MRYLVFALIGILLGMVSAQASDRAAIIESCRINLRLSDQGCNCIADKVAQDFSDKQMAMFMAVIKKDKAAQTAAMGQMTVGEMTFVGERMQVLPQECAG